MAKLGVAYGLCPLIDQSSLLGVSADSVSDCVIVTLGRNIIIRYRFQDQKQVSSWSSKDKLTSSVTYDPVGCHYVGVFNHNHLRLWTENDENLDKIKKHKFREAIHCIITQFDGDPTIVLFRNGCVALLTAAVESCKEALSSPILQSDESIVDYWSVVNMGRKFISFVSRNAKNEPTLNVVPVVLGESPLRFPLHRTDVAGVHLVGHTVLQSDETCSILTLWSDGQLFSAVFLPSSQEEFPGSSLLTVSALCPTNPVQMLALDDKYIALFGADQGEEGATMVLLNVQFRLVQSVMHFKLYSKPPRVFRVGNNLFVAVGNNLIVVPYQLDPQRLASLLGCHKKQPVEQHVTWFSSEVEVMDTGEHPSQEISDQIASLKSSGASEPAIAEAVISRVLEKMQVDGLKWCFKHFSDMTEQCLSQALTFCLAHSDCEELLDVLLEVPFSEEALASHIRALPFPLVETLLQHLHTLARNASQPRLLEWVCLLLDTRYQQYLLTTEPRVLAVLTDFKTLTADESNYTEELKSLVPLLNQQKKHLQSNNQRYSFEQLHLY